MRRSKVMHRIEILSIVFLVIMVLTIIGLSLILLRKPKVKDVTIDNIQKIADIIRPEF
jgi:hypothetical protein